MADAVTEEVEQVEQVAPAAPAEPEPMSAAPSTANGEGEPAPAPAESGATDEETAAPVSRPSLIGEINEDDDGSEEYLQQIKEIFARDVRVRGVDQELIGETDPEAYRKLHHMINTARARHTLRVLDEPQLTGVLPVTKQLQKTLKEQQTRWHKAAERAQKLAKKENAARDDEIKKVENRLSKELAALKSYLDTENKNHPPEERQSPDTIADLARKLKWHSWKEYDRVIVACHLDNMKHIYRLRMLDMLPCYQNIQIAEWMEIHRLEEEEVVALEKKHGMEVKRLSSNLRWGKFMLMMKGEKAMDDGVTVKKNEFSEYAQKRSEAMTEAQKAALAELRKSQAERRQTLHEQQIVAMDAVVRCQEEMLYDLQLDETAGQMSTERMGGSASRKGSKMSMGGSTTEAATPAAAPAPAPEATAEQTNGQ